VVEPLLRDPIWYVRAHAAEALGRIGDPHAIPGGPPRRFRPLVVGPEERDDALVRIGEPAKLRS